MLTWDSFLAFALIVGAAWFVSRRINKLRRPVCEGSCPGCYGARRGRGCALSGRDPNMLVATRRNRSEGNGKQCDN